VSRNNPLDEHGEGCKIQERSLCPGRGIKTSRAEKSKNGEEVRLKGVERGGKTKPWRGWAGNVRARGIREKQAGMLRQTVPGFERGGVKKAAVCLKKAERPMGKLAPQGGRGGFRREKCRREIRKAYEGVAKPTAW